jgi:hypothetical protein
VPQARYCLHPTPSLQEQNVEASTGLSPLGRDFELSKTKSHFTYWPYDPERKERVVWGFSPSHFSLFLCLNCFQKSLIPFPNQVHLLCIFKMQWWWGQCYLNHRHIWSVIQGNCMAMLRNWLLVSLFPLQFAATHCKHSTQEPIYQKRGWGDVPAHVGCVCLVFWTVVSMTVEWCMMSAFKNLEEKNRMEQNTSRSKMP